MIWRLLSSTVNAWLDDYAPSMGAALAFYTLFSIAPLLLIVISVAGFFFGEAAARAEIFAQISLMVGEDSATTLDLVLKSLDKPAASLVGMLVGLGTLLVGATTVFVELQNAMDRIWQVPPLPDFNGVRDFFRVRLLSLGLVLGIGFLLLVSLVLSALMAALGKWWAPWFGEFAVVADAVNFVLTLAFITAVFAMIYKWMPRTHVAWRDVWIGALITALLFTVGKTLIGLYIGRSAVASVFGAASSLVVLLLWVYYSAQVFLLGAEFTWVFAQRGQPKPVAPAIPQRPG
ncbi:YihY/virulence factor BrkB family protein [Hydrogenophaga taeniospiralis]|uniref:YihY/virulence factor BrkB family protein n=1 Tax=Hydrogenophaga taeniospiralis TaxID=65656 RepID=UPI001CFAF534|nr:YihY/virulence factor BrkB family protein [Hydrogenophaga taeniospiralis]UCU93187.1 YihY/virulence factor BrkB family protein [Hydrogenophaga taeniospiralis]